MVFENKHDDEERPGGGSGMTVDTEQRVCEDCRNQTPAWVKTCPECGGDTVKVEDLPPEDDPLLRRFLDEDDAAGGAGT